MKRVERTQKKVMQIRNWRRGFGRGQLLGMVLAAQQGGNVGFVDGFVERVNSPVLGFGDWLRRRFLVVIN